MKRTLLKDWKTRLSYFLQNSSTPGKPKTGKKSKQQTFIKPSPEEALLWAEAFDELLASKYGLAAFRAFLKSEFCEENIEFWLACEDFKKTKSPQKLSSKARKIYTDFIEKEAPKEINIDFQTKTLIAQNIQEATSGCFTTAQKRVYSLMENNSYPRFLESEFYQDLCKKPQITTEPHATWDRETPTEDIPFCLPRAKAVTCQKKKNKLTLNSAWVLGKHRSELLIQCWVVNQEASNLGESLWEVSLAVWRTEGGNRVLNGLVPVRKAGCEMKDTMECCWSI